MAALLSHQTKLMNRVNEMTILNKIATLLLFVFSSFAYGSDDDIKQLNEMIAEFQGAIADKNEVRFLELFYNHTVVFVGINPDKRKGAMPSNNGLMYSTHVGFIGWITSSQKEIKEKMWDINIQTDGDIAVIYFSYSFHMDDKKSNYGDESWSLIKTTEGWKIVSVLFSANYK